MSFLYPEFLYYLLPLILILFTFLLTQKEAEATFFSKEVMEKLLVTSNTLTLQVRNLLLMLVSILVIIALSSPVINEGKIEVKAKSADIIIALDISDSMLAEDVYPNRLESAKQKVIELLKLAPTERIGVIAFAKNSYLVSPLSFDHNAVGFLLRQLDTTSITEKGTNLLSMLDVVDKSIKKESKKYLLLLSDGGDNSDFSKEIAFAKEKNIAIFILGIGTDKGAPIKKKNGEFVKQSGDIIVSKLNENISSLATRTGGIYIENVRSKEDIRVMLSEIQKHSQKRELKSEEIERFIQLFYYPLGLALLLFLVATSSLSRKASHLVLLFVTLSFIFTPQNLHAGIFDFMKLSEAKEAYASGDYNKSSKVYKNFSKTSENKNAYYNTGNSLYKQKKYTDAIKYYEKATFEEKSQSADKYANIGNAYAKQMQKDSLQRAVESYEKSLQLKEDKDTRENLELVKKAIKKQQKKKSDKKNKSNKNKKKSNKKNSKEGAKSDKDKKSGQQKDGAKGDEKSNEKKKSMKDKKEQSKKSDKNKKARETGKGKEKDKDKEAKKKEMLKELEKKDKVSEGSQGANSVKKVKMSNAEEKKWLNKLNEQKNTYMYKLNNNKNDKMEDSDEKPW